jgi:hypothetical protein
LYVAREVLAQKAELGQRVYELVEFGLDDAKVGIDLARALRCSNESFVVAEGQVFDFFLYMLLRVQEH